MSFRDKYKKDNKEINISTEVINGLSKKMKECKQKKYRYSWKCTNFNRRVSNGVMAIALLFIMITGIYFYRCNIKNNSSLSMNNKATESAKKTDGKEKCMKNSLYNIYETVNIERSWVVDPNDTEKLLKKLDNISVIKAKVNTIEEPIFLNSDGKNPTPYPLTPINILVENVLFGEDLSRIDKIYLVGGKITIDKVMKTMTEDDIEKLGYNKLPKHTLDKTYIRYNSDHDYELNPSHEYVFILAKQKDNTYQILGNGYGIFQEEKLQSSDISYKNVLSGNKLIGPNGKIMK